MTRRRATVGKAECGSLPPPEWSLAYRFCAHGGALFDACPGDLPIKKFHTSHDKVGAYAQLLEEAKSGECKAYPLPIFFRVEFYEYDAWGRKAKDHYPVDSLSLAKLYCGASKALALVHVPKSKSSSATYYHFVLLGLADRERLAALVEALAGERRRIGPAATTALKRLYLSRLYSGEVWEVAVAKTRNRANLAAVERLALYDLSKYGELREALDRSASYLRDEDARGLAVEAAESLEAYFETGRVEHLYDALRLLHGHAGKADCDGACRYAKIMLKGLREVVLRG